MHGYRVTVTPRDAVSINDAGALIPDARLEHGWGGAGRGAERLGCDRKGEGEREILEEEERIVRKTGREKEDG